MKKETKIEIFFWLVVAFVFSPRVFLEVYEHKLKNSLIPFENNEWTVKDKDGNVIYEKLSLPYDLRWKEQKTNRREWIFEKEINTVNLKNIEDLGIVLGRIGDSDYAMFNDCLIGSTGFKENNLNIQDWAWADLRRYPIPLTCIKNGVEKIRIYIKKFEGPGFGIFGGPMGYGDFTKIKTISNNIDFIRYWMITAFGIGLIFFIGIQYLFVRILSDRHENYGTFGILSIAVGVYLIMTGTLPFRKGIDQGFLEKIIFTAAVFSSYLFVNFFNTKFKIISSNSLRNYGILSLLLLVLSYFKERMTDVYTYYEIWQVCFITFFIFFYIFMFKKRTEYSDVYFKKYLLAYSIFIFCCFHDIVVTSFGLSSSYFIGYAFTFFVLVVGLTLSREYADAFIHIEDQVIQRTHELNQALFDVRKIQNQKDDQAKRFSHDIRSPLAALKVLKDVISENIPEDQGSLLKHAIVRINDLSNTVLPKLIGNANQENVDLSPVFLWPVIDKIVSEKRLEYKNYENINIDFVARGNIFKLSAKCNEIELGRCLSNIINNSVQAKQSNKNLSVVILIEKTSPFVEITIQDSGKGIPSEIIPKVFDQGFSHNKATGMGIGLSSTKKIIESWQGKLDIHSTENIGTTITIKLPISEKPKWLHTNLDLKNIDNLVVIDDQPAVFETWKQRLQNSGIVKKIYWVQNIEAWDKSDASKLNSNESIYLVDQDLSSPTTGLDMIQKLKLGPCVILVTGNDDDLILRKKAIDLNISILPKSLIHTIPIET